MSQEKEQTDMPLEIPSSLQDWRSAVVKVWPGSENTSPSSVLIDLLDRDGKMCRQSTHDSLESALPLVDAWCRAENTEEAEAAVVRHVRGAH